MTLTETICSALKRKRLDVAGLVQFSLTKGYRSKSQDFALTVYRAVRKLIREGKVVQKGDTGYPHYRLTYKFAKK